MSDDESVPEIRQRAMDASGEAYFLQALAMLRSGDWKKLGYSTFREFMADRQQEIRLSLPQEGRRILAVQMSAEGVSVIDQAAILGVDRKTVHRDAESPGTNVPEPDPVTRNDVDDHGTFVPEPDVLDGPADSSPDVDAQIDMIKAGRFAANVRKVFTPIITARAGLELERMAEVAQVLPEFDEALRRDITWAREWFDQIDRALGAKAVPGKLRSVK